ncbi:hypothetical protein ACL02T_27405 [Pseudonocardia sp. RS010]|uniref:hypothetical protein n=1 Tax=Pseudonocardia sp. RS010 TaxID=3385979 RepID=UPI0039A2E4AD
MTGDANADPDRTDARPPVRVVLRPLGNPVPLACVGLAGATVTLAGAQLHWLPTALSPQVGLVLVLFAAPLQLVAAVLAYLARDAASGSGIGIQAATWLVSGAVLLTSAPGSRSPVLGLLLFVAAAGVLIVCVAAAGGKLVLAALFGLVAVRYALTGVYEYHGGPGWETAAGWSGLVLGALALYSALATDLDEAWGRSLLPLLRRGRGRSAARGRSGAEGGRATEELTAEPGVREQL